MDESNVYRLAMFLHLSIRVYYLVAVGWELSWIENAAPAVSGGSQFGYSDGYLEEMYAKLGSTKPPSACPVRDFVHAQPLTSPMGSPIINDLLGWWAHQRAAGHEYNGMTQMALDVLSTPTSSVDVERAFSFAGSIVSKRRHNLAPYTIQANASLGSYSKAGLVWPGILALPPRGKAASSSIPSSKV
ncbi:hypothetical protein FRC06_001021 [Ceratobasidium sp. 370]|nr:hypothetical protein FRC06_001021 [Ceratobasidium sp. 370]